MVVIGLAWIPVIQGGRGSTTICRAFRPISRPPIFVVFFFGRVHEAAQCEGRPCGTDHGFRPGLVRLAIDTPVKLPQGFAYDQGSFLWVVNNIYFQYYSLLILVISALVMVVVSMMTAPPTYEHIGGLTYGTLSDTDRKSSRSSWKGGDVIASVIVVLLIIAAYLTFVG